MNNIENITNTINADKETILAETLNQAVLLPAKIDNSFFHALTLYMLGNKIPFPKDLYKQCSDDSASMNELKNLLADGNLDFFKQYSEKNSFNDNDFPNHLVEKTIVLGAILRAWFIEQLKHSASNSQRIFGYSGEEIDNADVAKATFTQLIEEYQQANILGISNNNIDALNKFKEKYKNNSIYVSNKEFFEKATAAELENDNHCWNYWDNQGGYKNYCNYLANDEVKISFFDLKSVFVDNLGIPVKVYNYINYTIQEKVEVKNVKAVPFELVINSTGDIYLLPTTDTKYVNQEYQNQQKAYDEDLSLPFNTSEQKLVERLAARVHEMREAVKEPLVIEYNDELVLETKDNQAALEVSSEKSQSIEALINELKIDAVSSPDVELVTPHPTEKTADIISAANTTMTTETSLNRPQSNSKSQFKPSSKLFTGLANLTSNDLVGILDEDKISEKLAVVADTGWVKNAAQDQSEPSPSSLVEENIVETLVIENRDFKHKKNSSSASSSEEKIKKSKLLTKVEKMAGLEQEKLSASYSAIEEKIENPDSPMTTEIKVVVEQKKKSSSSSSSSSASSSEEMDERPEIVDQTPDIEEDPFAAKLQKAFEICLVKVGIHTLPDEAKKHYQQIEKLMFSLIPLYSKAQEYKHKLEHPPEDLTNEELEEHKADYTEAHEAATQLYQSLSTSLVNYLEGDKNTETFKTLKKEGLEAMNLHKPVLETHRNVKKLLANLFFLFFTLVVPYVLVTIGNCLFNKGRNSFLETDGEMKLDACEDALNAIPAPAA
ncbi:MAG: hypothetical protein H0U73_12865 [Tatlockia sp.]|nr:hypothetical protein [Tatlockia sp.]